MKIREAVNNVFSHNEIVAIWEYVSGREDRLVWRGMAYDLPKKYKDIEQWQIFGTIPENIWKADTINIRIWDGD